MDDSWDEDEPAPASPAPTSDPAPADHLEHLLVERGLVTAEEMQVYGTVDNLKKAGKLTPAILERLKHEAALRKILDLFPGSKVPDEVPPTAERVGRYLLAKMIGEGGMGEVWKAWDLPHHRWVAVKFLKGRTLDDVQRFLREANLAARLQHPGIIRVYEVVTDPQRPYIVMELVEGGTLENLKLDPKRAAQIVSVAARSVQYAHDAGIIHRDLKPGNLMESKDGRVLVMDFGLAKTTEAGGSLTLSGALVGTPSYMAPEQARGADAETRTDVYGLGATLWALVEGKPPFDGTNPTAIAQRITSEPAPRLSAPGPLELIVAKSMEREPRDRYARPSDLADDLDRFLSGGQAAGRPVSGVVRAWRRLVRRPLLSAALAAGFGAASVLFVLEFLSANRPDAELQSLRKRAADAIAQETERLSQSARTGAQALADYPRLRPTLEEEALHKEALGLAASEIETRRLSVDFLSISRADGTPVARGFARPDGGFEIMTFSKEAPETPWILGEESRPYLAIEDRLFVVASAPVEEGNRFLGVVVVGREVTKESVANVVKSLRAADAIEYQIGARGLAGSRASGPSDRIDVPLPGRGAFTARVELSLEEARGRRRAAWIRSAALAVVAMCLLGVLGFLMTRD